jgi:hypothetical protein
LLDFVNFFDLEHFIFVLIDRTPPFLWRSILRATPSLFHSLPIPNLIAQGGFATSTVIEETPEAPTQSEMTKFFFAWVNEKDNLFFESLLNTGPREREATRRHTLSGLT